ncbi:isoprenylcysteine carboxylmethyltransferase family protein [Candidatus Bathyarchaeota archaeon]|nr:isoprenylcysteine carboxylmethyltransferase family protein [Candidatus Bathyarchaeota archaeon]
MIILFFIAWIADSLSHFIFGYSTVILDVITVPALLSITILFLFFSYYLISKSHKAVLNQVHDPPQIVDNGVYAWVRHPMYLGILLFCLSFLFLSLSLIAAGIWILFYFIYDKMATYEEKKLIEILGEEYRLYQKKVSKWLPKIE